MNEGAWISVLEVFRFLDKGGFINWVIVILYLVSLAIACERAVYFIRTGYRRHLFRESLSGIIRTLLGSGDLLWETPWVRTQPGRMAQVFAQNLDRSGVALSEVLEREGADIRAEMERGLDLLSLIGALAPLCGLLGTVTGLMSSFGTIEALGGAVDMAALSGGIWEAMITTATGLAAAIPAVALCRIFEKIADYRAADMSYTVSLMTESLREDCLDPSPAESCPMDQGSLAGGRIREMA